jgi:hypothetical protein
MCAKKIVLLLLVLFVGLGSATAIAAPKRARAKQTAKVSSATAHKAPAKSRKPSSSSARPALRSQAQKAAPTPRRKTRATAQDSSAVPAPSRLARSKGKGRRNALRGKATARRASLSSRRVNAAPSAPDSSFSLRGSRESLERQNQTVIADGLTRLETDNDLRQSIARKELTPLPVSGGLAVSSDLPMERRYCRPWTAAFLNDLAHAHASEFHRAFTVSSAVRTVEYQKQLRQRNGNAAAAEGDLVSPHVTGATIDITKSGMTVQELNWFRQHLLALQQAGKIDAEEEFRQSCFHITVYKSYQLPEPAQKYPPTQMVKPHSAPSNGQMAPGQSMARRTAQGA